MSARLAPKNALPLCPSCGTWLYGGDAEIGDTYCRISAAYLIAYNQATKEQLQQRTNLHRATPLPESWPEPINWSLVGRITFWPNLAVEAWAKNIAVEYA